MNENQYISIYDNKKFVIEEDYPEVGYYLYVYKDNLCVFDSLQDNVFLCKEIAYQKFNVPLDSWEIFQLG